jgi:ClpX C4-type zinc finger
MTQTMLSAGRADGLGTRELWPQPGNPSAVWASVRECHPTVASRILAMCLATYLRAGEQLSAEVDVQRMPRRGRGRCVARSAAKTRAHVRSMVAGPTSDVAICDQCVDLCVEIFSEQGVR